VAKKIFITQWFSEDMRLAGETLLKRLDETNAQVFGAFWLQDTEEKTWKLMLISPLVENEGMRNYYQRISTINNFADANEAIIALHDIDVNNTHHRFVEALKNSVLRHTAIKNTRLGKTVIDGIFIEDMYVYRVNWQALETEPALI
jgi:ABC-type enterochelin transport system ATPase subunit